MLFQACSHYLTYRHADAALGLEESSASSGATLAYLIFEGITLHPLPPQELLDACGRAHGAGDIHRAVEAVHAASFPSWSLDLISGLPHLTPQLWQQSLDAAVAARPPHISVYDLQVRLGCAATQVVLLVHSSAAAICVCLSELQCCPQCMYSSHNHMCLASSQSYRQL